MEVTDILLIYGLVAALVVSPLSAIFDQWFFGLIALGSGVFATVLSFLLPMANFSV